VQVAGRAGRFAPAMMDGDSCWNRRLDTVAGVFSTFTE